MKKTNKEHQWAAAITTAQRPGDETLSASFCSITIAGFDDVILSVEPNVRVPLDCEHLQRVKPNSATPIGAYPNFRLALASLLMLRPNATHLVVFQDDVEVSGGLQTWLNDNMPDTDGVVSLYTAAPLHNPNKCGWHKDERTKHGGWGALGYVFRRDAAEHFIAHWAEWKDLATDRLTDYWIGQWCEKYDRDYWLHSPSFIRHTGDESCLGYSRNDELRQCREWCAEVELLSFYRPADFQV